jgi:hypothetical protein
MEGRKMKLFYIFHRRDAEAQRILSPHLRASAVKNKCLPINSGDEPNIHFSERV